MYILGSFKNKIRSRKKYFLEIRFPQFDKVSLFQIKTKSVSEEKQIGDYIPFKERDVPSRNLVFCNKSILSNRQLIFFTI
ncbi:MAG: hypothetical protein IPG24_20430 [Leptospiraceae bacterium]|nr:hypothetical protein [Leptospiraceae bacterium]